MTYQNRSLNTDLIEGRAKQIRLNLDGDVAVIRPIAVSVTWTIESNRLITGGERAIQSGPILTRSGIPVNQDNRTTGALDHEMKVRAFDVDEFRNRSRMIVSDARCYVRLLESAGN